MTARAATVPKQLLGTFAVVVYLLTYLPIVLVVLTSFNEAELTKLPIEHYSSKWYASLFENRRTLAALSTSIELGSCAAVAATLLGLSSALAVVRHEFPGKRAFLTLMTMPMLAPGIVLGVSMLLFARQVGFQTGFLALLLGHTLLAMPYCTFIIISSLARFDRYLEDAARGLGAKEWQVLARVTIPGIMPGIIGALLFGFTVSIGEFVVSFFLTSAGTTTLPIRIYSIVKVGITPEINAVSTLILAVTAVLTIAAIQLTWWRTKR
jgi:spermidine/putrescine transport system permease protein